MPFTPLTQTSPTNTAQPQSPTSKGFQPLTKDNLSTMPVVQNSAPQATPDAGNGGDQGGIFRNLLTGFGKGIGKTVTGIGEMGDWIARNTAGRGIEFLSGGKMKKEDLNAGGEFQAGSQANQDLQKKLEYSNTSQAVGGGIETGLEYLIGGPEKLAMKAPELTAELLAKKTLLSPTVRSALGITSRVATEGGLGYGQAKLKDDPNATESGVAQAGLSALGPVMSKILKVGGSAMKGTVDTVKDAVAEKTPEFFKSKIEKAVADRWTKAFPTSLSTMRQSVSKGKNALSGLYNSASQVISHMVENKGALGLTDEAGNARLPENRGEMYDAVKTMLKDVYGKYTDILKTADPKEFEKFNSDVRRDVGDVIDSLKTKLESENAVDKRKAITNQIKELQGLRDLSPSGLQNFVETLNGRAQSFFQSGSDSATAGQSAETAGKMRDIIAKNLDGLKGDQYKELRKLYGSYKAIESDSERAARNYINKVGNKLYENFANMGAGMETIAGLAMHDPMTVLKGVALKGAQKYTAYLKSPERNLKNLFSEIDNLYQYAGNKGIDLKDFYKVLQANKNIKPSTMAIPKIPPSTLGQESLSSQPAKPTATNEIPPKNTPDAMDNTNSMPPR